MDNVDPDDQKTVRQDDATPAGETRVSPRRDSASSPRNTPPHLEDSEPERTPIFDPLAPEINQWLVSRYQIRQRLGQGGMGMVWRAWDAELEREVAIKVLPPEIASDVRAQRQLKIEAQAAITLAHPNIVKVLSFRRSGITQFLEMEYVDGPSLADVLHRDGALSEELVQAYLLDICAGLGEAHRRGVIHRDIKPANLLLDPDGTIKIADFGIARIVAESTTRATGQATSGTLLYMSPEQLRGRPCDARSDLYSLGITAYELLTGEVPYASGDITYQHLHERPEPIFDTAPVLWPAIERMLEKVPEDRFPDAWSLSDVLGDGSGSSGSMTFQSQSAGRSAVKTPSRPRQPTKPRRGAAAEQTRRAPGQATVVAPPGGAPGGHAAVADGAGSRRAPWLWAFVGIAALSVVAILALPQLRERIGSTGAVTIEQVEDMEKEARLRMSMAQGLNAAEGAPDVWKQGQTEWDLALGTKEAGHLADAMKYFANAKVFFDQAAQDAAEAPLRREDAGQARDALRLSKEEAQGQQAAERAPEEWAAAEQLRTTAEASLAAQQWEAAGDQFAAAEAAYITARDKAKLVATEQQTVVVAQEKARAARAAAEAAQAATLAPDAWAAATHIEQQGTTALQAGDFTTATSAFESAIAQYATAQTTAVRNKQQAQTGLAKMQAAQQAQQAAKQAATTVEAAKYAGAEWGLAERRIADAAAQAKQKDYDEAVKLYAEATAQYTAAVTKAKTAVAAADATKAATQAGKNMRDAAARVATAKQQTTNLRQYAQADWDAAVNAETYAHTIGQIAARTKDLQTYADAAKAYGEAEAGFAAVTRAAEAAKHAATDAQAKYDQHLAAARAALDADNPSEAAGHLASALATGLRTPEADQLQQQAATLQGQLRAYNEHLKNARATALREPRKSLASLGTADQIRPGQAEVRSLRASLLKREGIYKKQLERGDAALAAKNPTRALDAVDEAVRAWPPETGQAKALRDRANQLVWDMEQAKQAEPTRRKRRKKSKFDYMGDR